MSFIVPLSQKNAKPKPLPSTYGTAVYIYTYHIYAYICDEKRYIYLHEWLMFYGKIGREIYQLHGCVLPRRNCSWNEMKAGFVVFP